MKYAKYFSDKIFLVGLVALLVRILSTLLITTYTLKFLNIPDYSFWLVVMTFLGFVDLFDFGVASTSVRKLNYILAGRRILPNEIYNEYVDKSVDYRLFIDFKSKVKAHYLKMSIYFFLVLSFFGTIYIHSINVRAVDFQMWSIFVLVCTLNFRLKYLEIFLLGYNKIVEIRISQVLSNCIQVMAVLICFFSGIGFFSLFCGLVVLSLSQNLFYYFYLLRINKEFPEMGEQRKINYSIWSSFSKEIWKYGSTTLSGFILSKSVLLLVASNLDTELTAKYGLTIQIFSLCSALLGQYISNSAPKLNRDVALKDEDELKKFVHFNFLFIIISFGFITSLLSVFGNQFLNLINPSYRLLENKYIYFIALFFCLELIMNLVGHVLLAFNFVDFYKSALISALLFYVFFITISYFLNDFLLILFLSQLAAQSYQYMKWPRFAYLKILKLNSLI